MGGDLVLTFDDNIINSRINANSNCRICHEEEEGTESCKILEAPCACSGTVKYAHRECIQRWCNEKGDTRCEICLQNYEPGYTAPLPLKHQPTENDDDENTREYFSRGGEESEEFVIITTSGNTLLDDANESYDHCSSAEDKTAFRCKTVVLILTVLLLARHLLAGGDGVEHCPFSLSTVFALKAFGILLPMYMIVRTVSAAQNIIQRHRHTYASLLCLSFSFFSFFIFQNPFLNFFFTDFIIYYNLFRIRFMLYSDMCSGDHEVQLCITHLDF